MTLEELEKEVAEIKARATADSALLRSALFTLSTAQLRGAEITLAKLAEDVSVKLLYANYVPDVANHIFEDRNKFWLDALRAEIAARDAAGRS